MENPRQEWHNSLQGSERDLEACVNIGCQKGALDVAASFLKHAAGLDLALEKEANCL